MALLRAGNGSRKKGNRFQQCDALSLPWGILSGRVKIFSPFQISAIGASAAE